MYPLYTSVGSALLLIWIIIHSPFSAACLEDERSYLLDFKSGFNLSSVRLSSWQGFNCCKWEGVGCDYHTSHVIRLDLRTDYQSDDWKSQQLTGELRPSLFSLQHLQHLDLGGNNFLGISIPTQFSKLQRLTFLSLNFAGFGGEVPVELGNLSSLHHLDIAAQSSTSKFDVWVRNLRSLEFLGMDLVNLRMASDHWGEALSGLANLTQIHLSSCGLSGKIPDLSNLTHLSHLDIRENSFPFELPSWFENVSSLVSLDLTYCHLNGSIPSNFLAGSRMSKLVLDNNPDLKGNLSFVQGHSSSLVMLYISECNLGGVLPPSLANSSKLQYMGLDFNNLEGSIPFSFGNISSLEFMYLSHNLLSGHIPPSLGQLSKLIYLTLGSNQLSGTIPDSISNLTSLAVLSLVCNQLGGSFSLQLLENLTRLIHMDLSENQLLINISTSWVPRFSQLQYIGLRSCNIEGNVPAFLSQQYQLEGLDLSNNSFVGNVPSWLWDLPSLRFLNLSKNQLEGYLTPELSHNFIVVDLHGNRLYGSLPSLDFVSGILDLSDNEFNGSIPATIGTSLSLSLSGNNLIGQIPGSICYQYELRYILDLSKNKLTGMIPSNIGRCSQLSVLKLAQNSLQGEIPQELGNLTDLQTLNFNGNKLQGIIPSSIMNCMDLQVFDLGNNKFEGSIPLWIEMLVKLRIFSLAANKFTHKIPPQLFRMQNLQILDLAGNQLSGSIPSDVSKLYAMLNTSQSFEVQHFQNDYDGYFFDTFFGFQFVDEVTVWIKGRESPYQKIIRADKFIDLSHNKLSGNIPLELGILKGLISLNISKNNLSGSIPESLGALAYLESLDLSENKLSGKIPSQLLNLTFLAVLNLSNNMLSGLIPQGKQFSTFDTSSFLGNLNLHGPPLENGTLRNGSMGSTDNHTSVEDGDAGGNVVMDRWWAVGVGLSFGAGFATVIAVLCFHIRWRYICFANMDNLIYYLLDR